MRSGLTRLAGKYLFIVKAVSLLPRIQLASATGGLIPKNT